MAELSVDVFEQILLLLDVKDLIRCRSVCKSWQSFISSPRFVKAHLNRAYINDRDNHQLGNRRIHFSKYQTNDSDFQFKSMFMVGSCDGLVCVSPRDVEFAVINPLTGEERKLPTPPFRPYMRKIGMLRQVVCWGFGYDSSADDYKVIAGFMKSLGKKRTLFHALTLKSNTWKVIGEVKLQIYSGRFCVLCGGSLHWFMLDKNDNKVIVSLDLSTDQLKEIPLPLPDLLYENDGFFQKLGVLEDCLCIYSYLPPPITTKKWVLKNNKWELYNNDHCQNKYDVAHRLTTVVDSQKKTSFVWSHDEGTRVPCNGYHIGTSIFVKSLVSPYPHGQKRSAKQHGEEGNNDRVESSAKDNIRKRNKMLKHKRPYDGQKRNAKHGEEGNSELKEVPRTT